VFVAAREVVKPIDVAEPGIVENFIAPGIEVDTSNEGSSSAWVSSSSSRKMSMQPRPWRHLSR
jgi:hypothetical protein